MYPAEEASNSDQLERVDLFRALTTGLHFTLAGLLKPWQTGSIVPSQRFLVGRMIAPIPRDYSGQILELGAGTGALTARLAAKCTRARILACEVNPTLARDCAENLAAAGLDDRVQVVAKSAKAMLAGCVGRGKASPGYIVSGLPLANFGQVHVRALIEAISRALARGGMYIQFQHSLLDRGRIKAQFPQLRVIPVFLNFPPAVVYYARK
jgi:phosphatidylethanolamine/phosphatidyl-N-methylethanolamine N-methyltransferase